MTSNDDRTSSPTSQNDNWPEQQKPANPGKPVITEPGKAPLPKDGGTGQSVDPEKQPTRQMTGGPDKPTA